MSVLHQQMKTLWVMLPTTQEYPALLKAALILLSCSSIQIAVKLLPPPAVIAEGYIVLRMNLLTLAWPLIQLAQRHRHQLQHNCIKVATVSTPKSHVLAQQAIQNVKANSQSSSTLKSTPNPKNAAKIKAVEMMKMRRKAEPANPRDGAASVPMDERLFVTVSSNGAAEKVLWVRKVSIRCH